MLPILLSLFLAGGTSNQGVSYDGGVSWSVQVDNTPAVTVDYGYITVNGIVGSNPCYNPTATLQGVIGTTTGGTSSVQIVGAVSGQKIYICSFIISAVSGSSTPTFKLQYGTGAACATGTQTILGPWVASANTSLIVSSPFAVVPAGQALCYIDTGTNPIQNYSVTYVQAP